MNDTTGDRIKRRREELGLSMYQVNQQTGFSHPALLNYERNKFLPGTVQAIVLAKALGVSVEWLMAPAVDAWLYEQGFDAIEPLTERRPA